MPFPAVHTPISSAIKTAVTGKEKTIFFGDLVSGDSVGQAGEGLHEATDALKDWFLPGYTGKRAERSTDTSHHAGRRDLGQ